MIPPNVAHALEYMALRRRFFSEPVDVAEYHMLLLSTNPTVVRILDEASQ